MFGVVPDRGLHRRPTEIIRMLVGVLLVALGAITATHVSAFERSFHDLVIGLPEPIITTLRWLNTTGAVAAVVLVLLAALIARRPRFIGAIVLAGAITWVIGRVLDGLIDAPNSVGPSVGRYPEYPNMRLAMVAAVFFVASPELTRPARRLCTVLLTLIAASLAAVTYGYPTGIAGALGLAWFTASLVHLILGSPDGAPSAAAVEADLISMGIEPLSLELARDQHWGESAFLGADAAGPLRVAVIGRDSTNAQFLTKVVRFIWMKDSGPTVAATREQQIEHRAYLLMLAERGGAPAPTVIDSGRVGERGDVVLVMRDRPGTTFDQLDEATITDDVLTAAWASLASLHSIGIAHGAVSAERLRLELDGTVAFTDLADADGRPSDDALLLDRVSMLVTLSDCTSPARGVASAQQALGIDGLTALQPLLEVAALPRATRRPITGTKKLVEEIRQETSGSTGFTPPKLTELRRVSPANILLSAATLLGFYLLVGQLAKVDFATTFNDAEWGWVVLVVIIAQLPLFGTAMALIGAVSRPLPLRPVLILQFANKFTGLVGGGVATMAMTVRFFQKQGLSPAVAVSSSLMSSFASGIVQVVVVSLGLLLGDTTFRLGQGGGGGGSGLADTLAMILGVVVLLGLVLIAIPRFRARLTTLVGPHLAAARSNFATVVSEPRKALQLFAGNLISQVCYALVLWAALHAYGQSLGLMQLIVINSIASIIGGIAPVPGGMGVIEAGLIAGFTAAGVPDQAAIAATFTARMFTAYLPPAWGWAAMQWMRRRDYI
jgi:uncharacterized membrane protein YbhN (UPF0104 family)